MTNPGTPFRQHRAHPYLLFLATLMLFATLGSTLMYVLKLHLGIIATQVVVVLGAALFYRHMRKRTTPDLPFHSDSLEAGSRWPSLKRLGMGPGTAFVVVLTSAIIGLMANTMGGLAVELVPALKDFAETYRAEIEELLLTPTPFQQVLGIIAVVLAAPICEEVLFRGTILPEQRQNEGVAMAVIVNGLLFSTMHVNPMAFVPLAIVGTFLAHLTIRTGSLWPAIIAHMSINTLNGVILPRLAEQLAFPEDTASATEMVMNLALMVPLTAGLWWLTMRLIRSHRAT